MGFLGVGKTTAILDLLQHKPENENWAVLVNEFGEVGIDGAIFAAAGATVKEVVGGCLCRGASLSDQCQPSAEGNPTRPAAHRADGLGAPEKGAGNAGR